MTRQLRMLRAHGLIAKIQKTHRYQLTTRFHPPTRTARLNEPQIFATHKEIQRLYYG